MDLTVPFPQLRLRSEFSFKQTFAPLPHMAEVLSELGCPAAGLVDGGTWGHVKWLQAAQGRFKPLFGREVAFPSPDGKKRPTAWALAKENCTKEFYHAATALEQKESTPAGFFAALQGKAFRFCGGALGADDAELFDVIDIDPSSPVDVRKKMAMAKTLGKPIVICSDNFYCRKEDLSVFLAIGGRERSSKQHIMSLAELREGLPGLSDEEFESAVANTIAVAAQCAIDLPKAPMISVPTDLPALAAEGKAYRLSKQHIAAWTPAYEERLQRELTLIAEKKYEAYFNVVADLVVWAKSRMLVGPARGSSAGSLVCYLLRITEVDPLVYGLLFERFIDVNRSDLPDIDIDFSDTHRESCFTYLASVYGKDNVARVGSINRLRSRSVINDACRRLGIPDHEKWPVVNVLVEYSSGDSRYGHALEDTLTGTEPGKRFVGAHPEAEVVYRMENHATHTGVHAAGVIVSNLQICDFCTVGADGVAQVDKPDAEHLNLLKIDVLGLRTLGVIEDSGVITPEELYSLRLDDQKVFDVFNAHKYTGIFQFEGQAQRRVASQIKVLAFSQIDHCTALARPGPLGGGAAQQYIARARGDEQIEFAHPLMEEISKETQGTVLYQEQTMLLV